MLYSLLLSFYLTPVSLPLQIRAIEFLLVNDYWSQRLKTKIGAMLIN